MNDIARLAKSLYSLFDMPGRANHPVVFRRAEGEKLVPMIDEGMHRCKDCIEKMLEVSDAWEACKNIFSPVRMDRLEHLLKASLAFEEALAEQDNLPEDTFDPKVLRKVIDARIDFRNALLDLK